MKYVNSLITEQSIAMVFEEGTKICKKDNPNFSKVKSLILRGKPQEALEAFDITLKLKLHSSGAFFVNDGIVYMDEKNPVPMPTALSNRVLQFADAGLDFTPLVNFWNNIQKNPSLESVKDLYAFLEHNGIPVTSDGCFCAYKSVQSDYKSSRSGVWKKNDGDEWFLDDGDYYDNTPGKRVEMPRNKVDANRDITCSNGLHVAAFNYAKNFGQARMILVKVNPADVVSVPTDYNNEKMRTCAYEVIEDITEELKTPLYGTDSTEYFDYIDEAEEIDTPVEDSTEKNIPDKKNISPDASGRVCIPKAFIDALGVKSGEIVSVFVGGEFIEIKPDTGLNDANYKYVVDRDGNVRLSKSCIARSHILQRYSDINVVYSKEKNQVILN